MRRVRKPLLLWKSNNYNIFWVCVCVCVCVCVALGIQRAMRMRRIVICDPPRSTIYFTLSHKRHGFWKKVIERQMSVLILSTAFVWNIFHSKKNLSRYDQKLYIGLHVKYPFFLFLSDVNKTYTFSTLFEKCSNIKFPDNLSIWSRGPCGQTGG